MRIIFSKNAWEDYTSWQTEDKKTLKKINTLIKISKDLLMRVLENQNHLNLILLDFGQDELIRAQTCI